MKTFAFACLFGLAVALAGCATNNWSTASKSDGVGSWLQRTIGKGQASDPRAREIEKRLGFKNDLGY